MSGIANTPEFVASRVSRGFQLEPLRMLAEGVAGVDEIDKIVRSFGRFRTGPFEHMDLVGLDTDQAVTRTVWEQLGRPARLAPHPLQAELVERGHLGRKSGRGFYVYDRQPPIPAVPVDRRSFNVSPGVYKAVRLFVGGATDQSGSLTEQYVFARTLAAIINEAALAVDEQLVSVEEIDGAMKARENYPRGPLEWAEKIGRFTCATLLRRLNECVDDDRSRPAAWLRS